MSSETPGGGSRRDPPTSALQALELLAEGIAHDLNNHLQALSARITLAIRTGIAPETLLQLQEAQRYAEDAAALSSQLRLLSQGGAPVRSQVDLRESLRRAVSQNAGDPKIACQLDLPDAPVMVEIDATQMHQLFTNLVRNAVQAMPAGGTLRAELTQCTDREDSEGRTRARVRISDTGAGIDSAVLPHIFKAHFSTRPTGSGLGLAICQSVASRHHAKLRCESELGKGTTFELLV